MAAKAPSQIPRPLPSRDMNQLKNLIFNVPGRYHHSLIQKVELRIWGFPAKFKGAKNVVSLIITIIMENWQSYHHHHEERSAN